MVTRYRYSWLAAVQNHSVFADCRCASRSGVGNLSGPYYNASKLGKPRAREGPRVGKPWEVSESCQKRWEAVGKKPRKALSESCRMPARVRTPSESRCRKAVEISALLGSGRALSCACPMCPWQLCLLFGSQAGVRANAQWSQRFFQG